MRRALLVVATLCAAAACGDDDDAAPDDAGTLDAGPWASGTLTCSHDVMSDYATRSYTFADPFDRDELGRNWDTAATDAWTIDTRLVVSGDGGGPGSLALVSIAQNGTDTVVWAEVARDAGWAGAPAVACRADGPPMTQGYGMRVLASSIELFEQAGTDVAPAEASAPLSTTLADEASVRVVLGCTADTVTGFVFALGETGDVGEELGCASWRSGDALRAGAVGLTHSGGDTSFDNVRITLDP